jgi:transcriptional regulator with XRE-family HTH domain
MASKSSFGENLEKLMKERRFSVAALAKHLGVPAKTVHEWVGKGGRMPRDPEALKKIAEQLDVSIYFLLYGVEDPKSAFAQILEKTEIHTGLYEITIKKVNSK